MENSPITTLRAHAVCCVVGCRNASKFVCLISCSWHIPFFAICAMVPDTLTEWQPSTLLIICLTLKCQIDANGEENCSRYCRQIVEKTRIVSVNGGHLMPRTDIGTVARSQEQSDGPGMMMPVLCHHQTVAINDRSNLLPKDQSNVPMASSSRFSLQHTVSGELTLGTPEPLGF